MTSCVIICDDISAKKLLRFKIVYNKKKFQAFSHEYDIFFNLVMRKKSFNIKDH